MINDKTTIIISYSLTYDGSAYSKIIFTMQRSSTPYNSKINPPFQRRFMPPFVHPSIPSGSLQMFYRFDIVPKHPIRCVLSGQNPSFLLISQLSHLSGSCEDDHTLLSKTRVHIGDFSTSSQTLICGDRKRQTLRGTDIKVVHVDIAVGTDWPNLFLGLHFSAYKAFNNCPEEANNIVPWSQSVRIENRQTYILDKWCGNIREDTPGKVVLILGQQMAQHAAKLYITLHGVQAGDENIHITLAVQASQESVEFLYVSNHKSVVYDIRKYEQAKLSIEHYETIDIEYHTVFDKDIALACEQIHLRGHPKIASTCIRRCTMQARHDGPMYEACEWFSDKMSSNDYLELFVGLYDLENDTYSEIEYTLIVTSMVYGPLMISYNKADYMCRGGDGGEGRRQGGAGRGGGLENRLMEITSLSQWYELIRNLKRNEGMNLYSFSYWIVHRDLRYLSSDEKQKNCEMLMFLKTLKHRVYCIYTGTNVTCNYFTLPNELFSFNAAIFCTHSPADIRHGTCSVVISIDYNINHIKRPGKHQEGELPDHHRYHTMFLYVPCDMTLDNAGYICNSYNSTQKHKHVSYSTTQRYIENELNRKLARNMGESFFSCSDGHFLLDIYVCDGTMDCPNGQDEVNCSRMCYMHNHYAPRLTGGDCLLNCHESSCSCSLTYFQCKSGGCIPSAKICDCYVDCYDSTDESSHLCSRYQCEHKEVSNSNPYHNRTPIKMPQYQSSCSSKQGTGGIPLQPAQLCDGIADCSHDIDERAFACDQLIVVPSLICPRERLFVPLNVVGDDFPHCNLTLDDEFPKLFDDRLPPYCSSKGLTLFCNHTSFSLHLLHGHMITHIVLTSLQYSADSPISLHQFSGLLVLKIKYSNIPTVEEDTFAQLGILTVLDISGNQIHYIHSHAFQSLVMLFSLNISHNPITEIDRGRFSYLHHLKSLDLSYTLISHGTGDMFTGLVSLRTLYFNSISTPLPSFASIYTFNGCPRLSTVYVVHAELCCLVAQAVCIPDIIPQDRFATCTDIISSKAVLVLSFVYVVLVLALNCSSFIWQLRHSKVRNTVLLCSLNVGDILMTVYIINLLVAHFMYSNTMEYVAVWWKESTWCRVTATIFMTSVLSSNIATLAIAIDHFIFILVQPAYRYGSYCIQFAMATVGWIFSILIPVLAGFLSDHAITNFLCVMIGKSLSFPCTIIYIFTNNVIFISIAVLYAIVVHRVRKSDSHSISLSLLVRLGAIVLTNFLASMTITILAIFSLSNISIPASLEAMLAFIIFPINSFCNPLINTVTTKQFCQLIGKRIKHMSITKLCTTVFTTTKLSNKATYTVKQGSRVTITAKLDL